MSHQTEPTDEGKRRYPGFTDREVDPPVTYPAGYNTAFEPPVPCTCTPACKSRCAGECGCEACKLMFAEYADMMGWYGPEPFVATEEHLQQYREDLGPPGLNH